MTVFESIFLAVIQGLTEFLPVSSSGHLAILQNLFKLSTNLVFFDILLHLGTLFSILFFFKNDIFNLFRNIKRDAGIWLAIIIGSTPAFFFGYFLNSKIEIIFSSMSLVGISMIVCGFIILSTKFIKKPKSASDLKNVSVIKSIVIGVFQAIAILPGISRSGSTITGGLWQGLSKETAFKFSFLLSIPAILGAVFLKVKDANFDEVSFATGLLATLISSFVGFFALRFLQKVLKSEKFWLFSVYCFLSGVLVLFFL